MRAIMWQIVLVSLLCVSGHVFGEKKKDDEELFTDLNGIEFDENYEDSFENFDGAEPSVSKVTSTDTALPQTQTYDPWSSFDILRKDRSVSLLGSSETIASMYHASLFPQLRFSAGKFFGHVGAPLRFPLYDNNDNKEGSFRSRGFVSAGTWVKPRDFRTWWDAQRILRHFEIGAPEDMFLVRFSRSHSITFGEGELLKTLTPDGLYDQDLMFFSGHVKFDAARVDAFVGPLAKAEIVGASLMLMPLQDQDVSPFFRGMNFGVSYVNDFRAPSEPRTEVNAFVVNDATRVIDRNPGIAQGLVASVSSEYFAAPWLSLKPYVSFGQMWLSNLEGDRVTLEESYGRGLHVGHDLTIYFIPGSKRSVLLAKAEGRLFSSGYWPGYFGPTYFVDRLMVNDLENTSSSKSPLTKSQLLSFRNNESYRVGYLFELGYSFDQVVTVMGGYENAHSSMQGVQVTPMRKMNLMTSFLGLDLIKFHLGYQATSIKEMNELFDFDESRALLSFRGQVKLAPYLYFDAWAKHSFGINDMYASSSLSESSSDSLWLSNTAESKSLNFGLGLEFAMTF